MISRTSIYVAAGRALGAREPDLSARNPDYLAEKLLGDPSQLQLDHPSVRALSLSYDEAMTDVEVVNNVRMMTIRARFIDGALDRAIAADAAQVVILGAGFDSHAYRNRDVPVKFFEVDRRAMQEHKRRRVNEVLGGPPENLTYVPMDLQHDDLAAVLARHGHDSSRRTFFILEGVTMYVAEDAVRALLQFVAAHPAGSAVVFDFVYRAMIDMLARLDPATVPESSKPFVQRFLDLIRDEPWVFGLPVDGEREFLAACGLELREVLTIGGPESIARYLTRADGTRVGEEAIAAITARMMERARAAAPSTPQAPQMSPDQIRAQQRLMSYQLAEAVVSGSGSS
jgi:methyltransferase (TIGR00027 family)